VGDEKRNKFKGLTALRLGSLRRTPFDELRAGRAGRVNSGAESTEVARRNWEGMGRGTIIKGAADSRIRCRCLCARRGVGLAEMSMGFGEGLEDGKNFQDLSHLQDGVVSDAKCGEGQLLAGLFAADQELDQRADSGGIEPFEFFEIEDQNLLGLFAQGLVKIGDGLEREAADQ